MNFPTLGYLPLHFNRTGSLPSTDLNEEASENTGNHAKCSKGCLGRDSIATAAATVGPAVVNISVTQGEPVFQASLFESYIVILFLLLQLLS